MFTWLAGSSFTCCRLNFTRWSSSVVLFRLLHWALLFLVARSLAASPGDSRSDSDNSNDGPGAALSDSASHELSNTDADASALYGPAVLRHCQRALQLLHDGGVRSSITVAAAPDASAGPFPLSDLILLARAAACSTAVPQLPTAARVRQTCSRAGVQAVDVIVNALVRPSTSGSDSTEGGGVDARVSAGARTA